ncbi:MAG: hypothetical protein Edafosvirus1_4 [Edafosvirus sp.]|uniref:RING-type domain-containing protein n=1 Tax=Edafosvirus sp. TaxID=2487765 RepID=A0A3G4ZVM4_9VIRU|nr:MAG: hypothetical protein Edafosvirus1_4 [Edafosvirus sp.]
MGNIDTTTKKVTQAEKTNFATLLTAMHPKNRIIDIDKVKTIIENGTRFDFYHYGKTFFHFLIVKAILYDKNILQKLCDLIYEYRNKFGDCTKKTKSTRYIQLVYDKEKNWIATQWFSSNYKVVDEKIQWTNKYEEKYYTYGTRQVKRENLYSLTDLDPMSFCLKVKTKFLAKNGLADNLNIVVDLLNKLVEKTTKVNPEMCVVCTKNKKNIMIRNCNHVCICKLCLKTATVCPVCKKDIVCSEEVIL